MEGVPGTEIVPLMWSVQGMDRGSERVRSVGWNYPVGAFVAIGEMLWWIGVVDEQLRTNYPVIYEASLAEEPEPTRHLLSGLRYVRNRITHAVDWVSYAAATATNPSGFEAVWTWTSLPPRADGQHAAKHADYEAVVAGRSVSDTLMQASLVLGTIANRVRTSYSTPEPR